MSARVRAPGTGIDEYMDEAQWRNVQEPIKQMFLSLSKALRVQGAGLRDLDMRCDHFMTTESVKDMISKNNSGLCSKEDATQLIYQIDKKSNDKDVAAIESKLREANATIDKLESQIQSQASSIATLTATVESLSRDVQALRNPTYDQVFAYVDRQVENLTRDTERQLATKAERREVETVLPQRVEELYRNLVSKYQDLKTDVARTVSKDEFITVSQNKVERQELKEILLALGDKISRTDAQAAITAQLRPLLSTVATIEKSIGTQDAAARRAEESFDQCSRSLRAAHERITNSGILELVQHNALNTGRIEEIVRSELRLRQAQQVQKSDLDLLLATNTEYCLKQLGVLGESVRLEITTSMRDELQSVRAECKECAAAQAKDIKDLDDRLTRTRTAVKELSLNTSQQLASKLDVSDFERTVANFGTNDFPQNNRLESIVRRSRELLRSPERMRGDRNATSGHSDSPESEANKEFDYLIRSFRSRESSSDAEQDEEKDERHPASRIHSAARKNRSSSRSSSNGRSATASGITGNDKDSKALLSANACLQELQQEVLRLRNQFVTLQSEREKDKQQQQQQVSRSSSGSNRYEKDQLERMDWRIALGEVSSNLRRDLSDKVNREEMFSFFRNENDVLLHQCKELQKSSESFVRREQWQTVEQELTSMKGKIAAELIGARFLWTSGATVPENWIPWDTQIVNAMQKNVLWQRGSSAVTVRVPGLYRVTLCVFGMESAVLQLFLNEEPLLSFQPDDKADSRNSSAGDGGGAFHSSASARSASGAPFQLRRLRHSAGEVTCISIDELLSLPAEARLSARFYSPTSAQAFMAIKKL